MQWVYKLLTKKSLCPLSFVVFFFRIDLHFAHEKYSVSATALREVRIKCLCWVCSWCSGKESILHAGDVGLIPGLGRSPGEGNGSPLQSSCLENPVDSGAWWATVHRLTKSWTRSRTQAHDQTLCSQAVCYSFFLQTLMEKPT